MPQIENLLKKGEDSEGEKHARVWFFVFLLGQSTRDKSKPDFVKQTTEKVNIACTSLLHLLYKHETTVFLSEAHTI